MNQDCLHFVNEQTQGCDINVGKNYLTTKAHFFLCEMLSNKQVCHNVFNSVYTLEGKLDKNIWFTD